MKHFIGILALSIFVVSLTLPLAVYAQALNPEGGPAQQQTSTPGKGFTFTNPLEGVDTLAELFDAVAAWLTNIAVAVAIIMFVYGGVRFILARGRPAEILAARNILKYTAIGLFIVFLARGLVSLVTSIVKLGGQ